MCMCMCMCTLDGWSPLQVADGKSTRTTGAPLAGPRRRARPRHFVAVFRRSAGCRSCSTRPGIFCDGHQARSSARVPQQTPTDRPRATTSPSVTASDGISGRSPAPRKNAVRAHSVDRANEAAISLVQRRLRRGSCSFDRPARCARSTRNDRAPTRPVFLVKQLARRICHRSGASAWCIRRGVYSGRRPHRRVNTQLSNLFVATRPLNSIRLAVSENASRIRPVGRAVTTPTPDQGDEAGGGRNDEAGPAWTLPGCPTSVGCFAPESAVVSSGGGTSAAAGAADPKPAMSLLAAAGPPLRASSIIPSNRPRIETPRRAASASAQARRSWSRRMPTTVDFEVAMVPLTVIMGVYITGAEWWQPGGRHWAGIASGVELNPTRTAPTFTQEPFIGPGPQVLALRSIGERPFSSGC